MTRKEFQREEIVKQIDKSFETFTKYMDDWTRGLVNGCTDTGYLLDLISTDEYNYIMQALLSVMRDK